MMVRIESSRIGHVALRDGDVFIATEEFARAEQAPGGIAGILRPALVAIRHVLEHGGAVIIDWPGGAAEHRQTFWASTGLDARLAKAGAHALSCVVTTAEPERLREARDAIARTRLIAPKTKIVLCLNDRAGRFPDRGDGTAGAALAQALDTHQGGIIVRIPKISGDSWAYVAATGMEMTKVLASDPDDVAKALGADEFLVTASIVHTQAWFDRTRAEVARLFPFREQTGDAGAIHTEEVASA